jgi:hypothetical protein
MLVGYARVSTADQNPAHQLDALARARVEPGNIYLDYTSGAKASRPQLGLALKLLRDGDTLKTTRLDRLGRSVLHLVTLGAELRGRGIGLHVVEQGIDTATAEGRAMFGMLSVLAELQRELIVANTRDGRPPHAPAAATAAAAPSSPLVRPSWPSSSTTPARRPSSRSPTSSASPAPPSTATSTAPPSVVAPGPRSGPESLAARGARPWAAGSPLRSRR